MNICAYFPLSLEYSPLNSTYISGKSFVLLVQTDYKSRCANLKYCIMQLQGVKNIGEKFISKNWCEIFGECHSK